MRQPLSSSSAFVALCIATRLSSAAAAQAPDPASCSRIPSCNSHHKLAVQQYERGDVESALVGFRAAYQESEEPRFLFDIGRCLQRLERPSEAIVVYDKLRRLKLKDNALNESLERYEAEARLQLPQAAGASSPAAAGRTAGRSTSTSDSTSHSQASIGNQTTTLVAGGPVVNINALPSLTGPDTRGVTAVPTSRTDRSAAPLLKRPWLWALLGGAVVVGGSAIAAGVLFRPGPPEGPNIIDWEHSQQAPAQIGERP